MDVLEFIARWHVAIIHFPIALIITAALTESALAFRRKDVMQFTVLLTAIAAGAGAVACVLGWMLAGYNPHSDAEDTLALHRWGGIVVTFFMADTAVLGLMAVRSNKKALKGLYRAMALVVALGTGAVAHWGGELIYGPGYFWPENGAGETEAALTCDGGKNLYC